MDRLEPADGVRFLQGGGHGVQAAHQGVLGPGVQLEPKLQGARTFRPASRSPLKAWGLVYSFSTVRSM
jgi:hypothetical protein